MECGPQLKPEEPEYPDIPKARIREVDCKQGAIRCVRFSVDGNYCMTGGADKSLKLWNPNRGSLLKTYMGHGYEVLDCQGSCDNSQLVSCSMDKSVVLWDVTSGNFTRKWRGHQASVNCVRFNEECTVVMSGSVDTCVKIWDTKSRSQEPIQTLEDSKDNVTSMDVSDHEILVGSADKHFRNYDLRMGSVVSDYVGDTVSCVRFTRDGQCILVSAVSSSLKLFDKTTGEMLQEFMGHVNKDYRLECCMDFSDKYVLSGSENAQVYIWDLVEGGCVAKLDHLNLGAVHSLAPHPSTAQLLTGAQGTLTVWDTGEEEEEMEQEPVLSSSSGTKHIHNQRRKQFTMCEVTQVKMNRDRTLMDPDFSGYKLSLEGLAVTRTSLVHGPVHTLPTADMYSFLHAKMFGEHNHLVLDTFNENIVYFISGNGSVYSVGEDGTQTEVWNLPESGKDRSYNPALVFASENLAILSDGTETLFILETGDRKLGGKWKAVFHDAVCGKDRSFEARYGVLQAEGSELEVVLQYVEEKEKMDGAEMLPKSSGESSFFNVLEWISFSRVEKDKSWMMERVRRVISHGGFNYVSITGSNLAVSAEKKTILAFDSLHPVEHLNLEKEEKKDEPPHFYWKQTDEDIEMWFYVISDTTKNLINIEVKEDVLEVKLHGSDLLRGQFEGKIEKDSWTWTLENGKVGILMTKQTPGLWSKVWGVEGGARGLEVTDTSADTVLPHLTTDNPICTGEPSGEPAFNAQELESVDDCMDENSMLIWQSGAGSQHVASLAGQQHLLVVQQLGSTPPALCVRYDVDGFVWKISDSQLEHVASFPALGYVQAGKASRKFLVAPHTFSYSAICDASRHVYIYRQPKPLEPGHELRNRKSGTKIQGVAMQQVVTLENNEEILGIRATPSLIFIITPHSLYRIQV